jgi:anti-anti-sigma factor
MQTIPTPRTADRTAAADGSELAWSLSPGRPPRLVVTGEIDLATLHEFDHAMTVSVARHRRLIVDLTGVEFLASSGIRTLYAHLSHLVAVLVSPDNVVARALSTVAFPCLVVVPGTRRAGTV